MEIGSPLSTGEDMRYRFAVQKARSAKKNRAYEYGSTWTIQCTTYIYCRSKLYGNVKIVIINWWSVGVQFLEQHHIMATHQNSSEGTLGNPYMAHGMVVTVEVSKVSKFVLGTSFGHVKSHSALCINFSGTSWRPSKNGTHFFRSQTLVHPFLSDTWATRWLLLRGPFLQIETRLFVEMDLVAGGWWTSFNRLAPSYGKWDLPGGDMFYFGSLSLIILPSFLFPPCIWDVFGMFGASLKIMLENIGPQKIGPRHHWCCFAGAVRASIFSTFGSLASQGGTNGFWWMRLNIHFVWSIRHDVI